MAVSCVLLTIVLPWIGSIAVWMSGNKRPRLQHMFASAFAVGAGFSALLLLLRPSTSPVVRIPMGEFFGDLTLVPDGLGIILAIIASVVGSLTVIFSIDYMRGEAQLGRYYALVLFFIGAMSGLGLSGSFLLMFFFWEITAFCSYALISFHNDDPKAVYGGIKALIMTQFGGVGLLLSALVIQAHVGSFQINDFLRAASTLDPNLRTVIAFGLLVAAVAKSAQIPLHTWLPDAMEAPTPVTALIHAATMVNAGVYLLARFHPALESTPGWTTSVVVIGSLSAFLAALMAIRANDLKRALAYSTISQLGYMVYAIGVGGLFASMFHLLSHAIFKALLFLGAGAVIHIVGTRDMRRMGALRKTMPTIYAAFLVGSAALVGLPLANGFLSKELILERGLQHGPSWAFGLMLFGTCLTAIYATRIVRMVFYGDGETRAAHDAPIAMRLSLTALTLGVLTTWLLAGPFSHLLSDHLPFHSIHTGTTAGISMEVVTAPVTWAALGLITLGFLLWTNKDRLGSVHKLLRPLNHIVDRGYGFESLLTAIVQITRAASKLLRATQTGQLNFNVAGVGAGFCVLLALLLWGV